MARILDQDWQDWIATNLAAGCDKNGIFRILWDEGFDYDLIVQTLGFEPAVPVSRIENPLKKAQKNCLTQDTAPPIDYSNDGLAPIANSRRLCPDKITFVVLDDFLNPAECEGLQKIITARLRPSEITRKDEPDRYFRTSHTCDLGLVDDPLVQETDRRLAALLGLDPVCSEGLQGQHYRIGEEFKAHTDYFEADELAKFDSAQAQRSYTVMVYLNDVDKGGETVFSRLDQTIMPKAGRAVIWNSLNPDGSPNPNSLHQACPVIKGHKTVITKWFRTRNGLPVFVDRPHASIPSYTRTGFKKTRLDHRLFTEVRQFYKDNQAHKAIESVPGNFITASDPGSDLKRETAPSYLIELPPALKGAIFDHLKPRLEDWSGISLQPTYVYGIRQYQAGAQLRCHRDRLETHIISAIINVDQARDQNCDQDWPLEIDDHAYRRHQITLKAGEVIFYEGARLRHGRPQALQGRHYANIFCHFMPESPCNPE